MLKAVKIYVCKYCVLPQSCPPAAALLALAYPHAPLVNRSRRVSPPNHSFSMYMYTYFGTLEFSTVRNHTMIKDTSNQNQYTCIVPEMGKFLCHSSKTTGVFFFFFFFFLLVKLCDRQGDMRDKYITPHGHMDSTYNNRKQHKVMMICIYW